MPKDRCGGTNYQPMFHSLLVWGAAGLAVRLHPKIS
jgi:hypothetical protein